MPRIRTHRIGELARDLNVPVETIRYYEREKLLPEPRRTAGNYRLYSDAERDRLSFIRNCRSLDMTLDEVRALLAIKDSEKSCEEVNALLDSHIQHVADRISELRRLREQLQMLRDQCGTVRRGKDCAILKELSSGVAPTTKSGRGPMQGSHRR